MKNIVVDFETYYDAEISVTEMGLPNYAAAADPYLVSVVSDDFEFCGPPADLPKLLDVEALSTDPNIQFWAFHANFDHAFWRKLGLRSVHPWKCGIDLAAFHQYPRALAGIAKAVLHVNFSKEVRDEMKGVRFESLPDSEQQRVADYCLNDSIRGKQIIDRLPPMSPVEEAVAEHTRMMNRRGVHIDLDKVERDKTYLARIRHEAFKAIPWTKDGEKPLSYPTFSKWCAIKGAVPPTSLDKRDAECEAWMVQNPTLATAVRSMRAFRGSNTKLEKLKTLLATVNEHGVMPLEILYCGARHTRRWSSKGFNVQNLDKERAFADEMAGWPEFTDPAHPDHVPGAEPGIFLREYLIPPPGCVFGIIDYSQIEPRCLNWLAQNEEMLTAIRAGYGIYEAHAVATMNWKGAPGTLKKTDPHTYQFAKIRVLALGYGMGADKFLAYAKVIGLDLTAEQAWGSVQSFRASNRRIVSFWRRFDRTINEAVLDREKTLSIRMPTGDRLDYFQVRSKLSGGYEGFTIRGDFGQESRQPRLWGGTLTENATQRMARDILAEAILKLERAGFPVIFHAHDEVILALDQSSAEADLAEAIQIMSQTPEWCPGLPLAADGGLFHQYTKML